MPQNDDRDSTWTEYTMNRVIRSNRASLPAKSGSISVTDTQTTDISPRKMSRETAERIMENGSLTIKGKTFHVFDNRLSHLPPIKNDELANTDIIIFCNKGMIDAGEYGPSYVLEIGVDPSGATHSWLVNCTSVIGKNLRPLDNDADYPMWAHVAHITPDKGNPYYTLKVPAAIREALSDTDDPNDLPF